MGSFFGVASLAPLGPPRFPTPRLTVDTCEALTGTTSPGPTREATASRRRAVGRWVAGHLWSEQPLPGRGGRRPSPRILDEPRGNEEALTDTQKSPPSPPAVPRGLDRAPSSQIEVARRAASQVGMGTRRDTVWARVCTRVIAGDGRGKSFQKPSPRDQEGTGGEGKGRGSAEQVWGAENKKETRKPLPQLGPGPGPHWVRKDPVLESRSWKKGVCYSRERSEGSGSSPRGQTRVQVGGERLGVSWPGKDDSLSASRGAGPVAGRSREPRGDGDGPVGMLSSCREAFSQQNHTVKGQTTPEVKTGAAEDVPGEGTPRRADPKLRGRLWQARAGARGARTAPRGSVTHGRLCRRDGVRERRAEQSEGASLRDSAHLAFATPL